MKHTTVLTLAILLLTGCGATMFGMSEQQFRTLSPEQQQVVINNYNQRQMEESRAAQQREIIRAQNEPLNSLVGVAGHAVGQLKSTKPFPQTKPQYQFKDSECQISNGKKICRHEERHSGTHFSFG
jgi:uncharacterized protein HemX